MRIRNQQDFWAGVMFTGIGVLFAVFSTAYEIGTAARMGPGYFPLMLGILLAILGLIIAWRSTSPSHPESRLAKTGWREILLILGAVALFGATLSWLGMVISIVLLIFVAAIASHEFSWKETVVSIVVLLIMSELVFVKGLELQFPVWPKFLTN
ncbi:tripartite tricarboxylate transporter TctB family protein [Burkholderiaceae bacterium FT117]|uniref:tripartite tricarboxylate transporter TctB family protein n=1 Tax=Zeimonas sediminis TaxID=2944268 RepID=UPI002342DAAE|nr:tripartite tricarboxylate transporter TctB family protein [Zeimonas sediminis]MCM5570189.1 tripartite tricarboxylate transporter TctB family protein [Zeimonas sediminis]